MNSNVSVQINTLEATVNQRLTFVKETFARMGQAVKFIVLPTHVIANQDLRVNFVISKYLMVDGMFGATGVYAQSHVKEERSIEPGIVTIRRR